MFFTKQILQVVTQWPVASQQRARRNAMIATTALTRGRVERDEVEEFLTTRYAPALPEPAQRPEQVANS